MPRKNSPAPKDSYEIVSAENVLRYRGYVLEKKVGEGSYAKVYLSIYTPAKGTGQPIRLACKVIDTSTAAKEYVKKFLPRELEILPKMSHPYIVHVHSMFQMRFKYYIFMRFAERGDLLHFIIKHGSIGEKRANVWFKQLLSAILYLHQMNIAHRDLKCENVLISMNYNMKLADFGFARSCINKKGKHIFSETFCGSLSYAAPELIRGVPYKPKLCDMWSLGVILFVMLTKSMPFSDSKVDEMVREQKNRSWTNHAKVKDSLSDPVKKLLNCLLEPDVMLRWSAEQVTRAEWVDEDASKHTSSSDLPVQNFSFLRSMLDFLFLRKRYKRRKKGERSFTPMKSDSQYQ